MLGIGQWKIMKATFRLTHLLTTKQFHPKMELDYFIQQPDRKDKGRERHKKVFVY